MARSRIERASFFCIKYSLFSQIQSAFYAILLYTYNLTHLSLRSRAVSTIRRVVALPFTRPFDLPAVRQLLPLTKEYVRESEQG